MGTTVSPTRRRRATPWPRLLPALLHVASSLAYEGVTLEPEVVTSPVNASGVCVCQPQVVVKVPQSSFFDSDGSLYSGDKKPSQFGKPSRYTHTLAYVIDLVRKIDTQMEAQSYALSILAERFGMNVTLLFPMRVPRLPMGTPETLALTTKDGGSAERRRTASRSRGFQEQRPSVKFGGSVADRRTGIVGVGDRGTGRGTGTLRATDRGTLRGSDRAGKPGVGSSSGSVGSSSGSSGEGRRRDSLLLDGIAEVQDQLATARADLEEAFAAQSKMLGDVIHGCWVRPKPGKSVRQLHPRTCVEVKEFGGDKTGVYTIYPEGQQYMDVVCDVETEGGGWLTVMRRESGDVDFYRGWQEYKIGFGSVSGEYWLGLENIHKFASMGKNTLRIDMEDFQGNKKFAEYNLFTMGDEKSKYQMDVSGFRGTAGDSLSYHSGRPFSTWDSDNDNYEAVNCALNYKGAWWYNACHRSCLTGVYSTNGRTTSYGTGIIWGAWKGFYSSLKTVEIKIRPMGYISS